MSGASIAADDGLDPRVALRRFARALRWRHVLGRSCGAALRWGLLLALPVVAIAWLLPSWAAIAVRAALLILLPLVVAAALIAWWRGRRVLAALAGSVTGSSPDEGAAMLRDELATWVELDRWRESAQAAPAGAHAGMLRWLERDVHVRLLPHRKRALASIAKPQLGRWRWLLPLVLLLVLLWLLALWLAPPWSGAAGGRPDQPSAGSDRGEGGQGSGGAGQGSAGEPSPAPAAGPDPQAPDLQEPDPQEPDPQGPPDALPPPDPGRQDDASAPANEEPPPLLELGDDQRVVLPDFIGDGPTRRARMHAAERELLQAGSQAQKPVGRGSASDQPQQPPPEPPQLEFERAAERAQRARHVPPHERAMVRRFFDKLRQKGS